MCLPWQERANLQRTRDLSRSKCRHWRNVSVCTFILCMSADTYMVIWLGLYGRSWAEIELYCAPCNHQAKNVGGLSKHAASPPHIKKAGTAEDFVVQCLSCHYYIPGFSWEAHICWAKLHPFRFTLQILLLYSYYACRDIFDLSFIPSSVFWYIVGSHRADYSRGRPFLRHLLTARDKSSYTRRVQGWCSIRWWT